MEDSEQDRAEEPRWRHFGLMYREEGDGVFTVIGQYGGSPPIEKHASTLRLAVRLVVNEQFGIDEVPG